MPFMGAPAPFPSAPPRRTSEQAAGIRGGSGRRRGRPGSEARPAIRANAARESLRRAVLPPMAAADADAGGGGESGDIGGSEGDPAAPYRRGLTGSLFRTARR